MADRQYKKLGSQGSPAYAAAQGVPSQVRASQADAGAALRENYSCGAGYYAQPGAAGQGVGNMECQFAPPPPRRVYCHAVPFTQVACGSGPYHYLKYGYGMSAVHPMGY